jgi:hypothetical protein
MGSDEVWDGRNVVAVGNDNPNGIVASSPRLPNLRGYLG